MDVANLFTSRFPEFPDYKEPSEGILRLYWTLDGPLESAIQVTPTRYYEPDAVMEPYFRPATDNTPASWHPVSQESLLLPAVSSFTAKVGTMDYWEQLWADLYYDCPEDDHPEHGRGCCGQRGPRAADYQLEVTTTGPYLTVHEFVSTVHPWLMSLRGTFAEALNGLSAEGRDWTPESHMVLSNPPGPISIVGGVEGWAKWHKKPYVPDPSRRRLSPEELNRILDERMMENSRARIREREAAEAREREQGMEVPPME